MVSFPRVTVPLSKLDKSATVSNFFDFFDNIVVIQLIGDK